MCDFVLSDTDAIGSAWATVDSPDFVMSNVLDDVDDGIAVDGGVKVFVSGVIGGIVDDVVFDVVFGM